MKHLVSAELTDRLTTAGTTWPEPMLHNVRHGVLDSERAIALRQSKHCP